LFSAEVSELVNNTRQLYANHLGIKSVYFGN